MMSAGNGRFQTLAAESLFCKFALNAVVSYARAGHMFKILFLVVLALVLAVKNNLSNTNYLQWAGAKPTTPKPEKPSPGLPRPKNFNPFALWKSSGVGAVSISGKIGGTVFNAGGSAGAWLRNWAKPKNGRTNLQQFVRGVLSGISSSFRALTPSQVSAWNQAATSTNANALRTNVFGDSKVVSGSALYQRINNICLQWLTGNFTDPPAVAATDSILNLSPVASAGGGTFTTVVTTFNGAVVIPANTVLALEATPMQSNGRSFFGKSQYRVVKSYGATVTINPLDIFTAYTDIFGPIVEGQKISLRARFIFKDTGLFAQSGAFTQA